MKIKKKYKKKIIIQIQFYCDFQSRGNNIIKKRKYKTFLYYRQEDIHTFLPGSILI